MPPESNNVRRQLDLLRLRRRALRIAVKLFEESTCQEEISETNSWFELANSADDEQEIIRAIENLIRLATLKNIPTES